MNDIFQQPLLTEATYRPRKHIRDCIFPVDIIHSLWGMTSFICYYINIEFTVQFFATDSSKERKEDKETCNIGLHATHTVVLLGSKM